MSSSTPKTIPMWRLLVPAVIFVLGVGLILHRLWQVQVEEGFNFARDLDRQSIRRVQIPGQRGQIVDRNGLTLADCRPSYCIVLYAEELRRPGRWSNTVNAVEAQVQNLSRELGLPVNVTRKQISDHIYRSLPMPLFLWRDVNETVQAEISEKLDRYTGVDLFVMPEREYPYGSTAAQVLGYIGRGEPKKRDDEKWHFSLPEMEGRTGLEGYYNTLLTGQTGVNLIRVDARGYRHDTWQGRAAAPGHTLHTTLDIHLQQALEKTFGSKRGAGVVLNPKNGEVLAMASMPTYDNSKMVPAPSTEFWQELLNDPAHPLLNRAIQGRYPPGSTFKPFTALAGLNSGISTNWEHYCSGVFTLGTMRLRCWNTYGHHEISMHNALAQSCNSYFCQLVQECGYPALVKIAQSAGIGRKTGIDLPSENAGLLPTPEWKKKEQGEGWRSGDSSQVAIGQGLLLTTPLQMAVATAAIANGGAIVRPHLIKGNPALDEPLDLTGWDTNDVAFVTAGMRDVVEGGTGRRLKIEGLSIAAKTGSAEYDRGGVRRKYTWMTAFAPIDNPQIAIAIVVEDGESGGLTVAPMMRQVLLAYFGESAISAEEPVVENGSQLSD